MTSIKRDQSQFEAATGNYLPKLVSKKGDYRKMKGFSVIVCVVVGVTCVAALALSKDEGLGNGNYLNNGNFSILPGFLQKS